MSKTVISLDQPTPKWVTWIFRIQFVLNKAVTYYITGAENWSASELKHAMLILGTIDLAVWGIGRFIGEEKSKYDKA